MAPNVIDWREDAEEGAQSNAKFKNLCDSQVVEVHRF